VGKSLIEHVLGVAQAVSPKTVTIVVGHEADSIRRFVGDRPNIGWVLQEPQLGTAHALQQTESQLAAKRGTLILLSGDVPMLEAVTLQRLVHAHQNARAAATVVTAVVERPYGYGRIVRTRGRIARIVEERDASPAVRQIREINGGIYAFDLAPLFDALRGSPHRTPKASTTLRTWSQSTVVASCALRPCLSITRRKSAASTAAQNSRK
jgi:bifunctional UDP-N-acetylglucosamine pyrophosphorylase/glucosamine-1-phosphate N-acetyltransferase